MVADPRADAACAAVGREDAVGEIVDAEGVVGGDVEPGHEGFSSSRGWSRSSRSRRPSASSLTDRVGDLAAPVCREQAPHARHRRVVEVEDSVGEQVRVALCENGFDRSERPVVGGAVHRQQHVEHAVLRVSVVIGADGVVEAAGEP